MNAVGVEQYGPIENLICRKIPKPDKPQGKELLINCRDATNIRNCLRVLIGSAGDQKGEKVGILIINGAGGVGAMASQIARWVLELPVVITTASRPETIDFTKKMGATHVINHREDLKKQIDELHLDVPIKYVYITYSTSQYLGVCSEIIAPLGKVCSIVQSADMNMYGTQFMSKSLAFVWCWLGSRMYHGLDTNQWKILEELSALIDAGKIKCHLTRRLQLDLEGIKEAHRILEAGKAIGKVGLGLSEGGWC
ncbi:hypothetical protein APSETT445_009489 [Aspergillus pseudonomiae]